MKNPGSKTKARPVLQETRKTRRVGKRSSMSRWGDRWLFMRFWFITCIPTYPCRVSQHVESFRQIKRLSRDAVNYSCWLHILLVSMRHLVDIQVVQQSRIPDGPCHSPKDVVTTSLAITALKHPCCRRNRCHGAPLPEPRSVRDLVEWWQLAEKLSLDKWIARHAKHNVQVWLSYWYFLFR